MKIGVYAKSVRDHKHESGFNLLLDTLNRRGHEVWCTQSLVDYVQMHGGTEFKLNTFQHLSAKEPLLDLLICVGGDGTMLDAISLVRDSNVPVLGLNTGRSGFSCRYFRGWH